jgi:putative endonuclease
VQPYALGEAGEDVAAEYLQSQGFDILAKRFKRPGGELDVIGCLRDDCEVKLIVFVEVKARRPSLFGRPEQAVSKQKMRRMYRTAHIFLHERGYSGVLCRFDVMAVYWMKGRLEIEHFEEAFGLSELMDMD